MKKLTLLVLLCMLITLSAIMVACEHEHTYSDEWTTNNTHHWHEAACGHDEVSDKLEHSFGEDNICTECGYEKKEETPDHQHQFSNGWLKNNTYHWHPTICGHMEAEEKEMHDFVNYKCSVCDYEYIYTEELRYILTDDSYYRVVSIGLSKDIDIVIASIYNGKPVTSIGDLAFGGCENIKSITIPDSVTSIGRSAFSWCSSLESITIPSSVTSIGGSAFRDCSSLESITIPSSGTSIGDLAFSGCSSLESIEVSTNNTVYHSKDNCLIETATKTLVAGCKTSIIPNDGSVTSIGYCAFSSCSSLESITIPDSVTSIETDAFTYCSSLESVIIGNSVTSIGYSAFRDCTNLASITIGSSVTSIGGMAFSGCSSLASIIIPNSVISIEESAFYDCSSLESVYYIGTADEWEDIEIDSDNDSLTGATIYYYSETAPTDEQLSGGNNYWHYGDDGFIPEIWE